MSANRTSLKTASVLLALGVALAGLALAPAAAALESDRCLATTQSAGQEDIAYAQVENPFSGSRSPCPTQVHVLGDRVYP